MRDPVTLAIVSSVSALVHAGLRSPLRAALPRVGVLDPGVFACDRAGTEELRGAPARIARRVLARCARVGAQVSAGIAPTPFVARVVAERTPAGEVRAVEDGRAFLSSLPLDVLPVDEKVREELRLLGLRIVGDFAELPRGAVFDRFGSAVARAHALARGEFGDMVRATAPPRRIRARWRAAGGSDRDCALSAGQARPRCRAARAGGRRGRAPTRTCERVAGGDRMRLFNEPLPAKLVWDEGELVTLIVAGHRHTVVEQMRKWRVEADWWKDGVVRDYLTLRTADGLVCDVYGDRGSGAWWLQRVMD